MFKRERFVDILMGLASIILPFSTAWLLSQCFTVHKCIHHSWPLADFHRDIASAIKELLDTVNNVFKKYQYQNRRVSISYFTEKQVAQAFWEVF